jgi:YVTN family beta-propeller protein
MKVQPNTGLVYVTTSKFTGATGSNVQIIDPATNTLVGGFSAGESYTWPIAFSSDGAIAYVVESLGVLVLIDTASQTIMTSVPSVGFVPALAYQSTSGLVVVPEDDGSVISLRDGVTAAVVRTIEGPGGVVGDLVLSRDGETAYVSTYSEGGAAVIDLSSGTISATIPTGASPSGVALNPTETLLYVANYDDNTVSVIDLATNSVLATVGVGTNPNSIAFNLTGNLAYVTNNGDGSVSIIDVATSTNIGSLAVGSEPLGVLVLPSGDVAYVANQGGDSISVLCRGTR